MTTYSDSETLDPGLAQGPDLDASPSFPDAISRNLISSC